MEELKLRKHIIIRPFCTLAEFEGNHSSHSEKLVCCVHQTADSVSDCHQSITINTYKWLAHTHSIADLGALATLEQTGHAITEKQSRNKFLLVATYHYFIQLTFTLTLLRITYITVIV